MTVGMINNMQHRSAEKPGHDQTLQERAASLSGWEHVHLGLTWLLTNEQAFGGSILKIKTVRWQMAPKEQCSGPLETCGIA